MKVKEVCISFALLEKYSINFNEYALAKMIALAKVKQNAEMVEEYFLMRMCCRGKTIDLLQGLKDAGLVDESYEIPKAGSVLEPCSVPLDGEFMQDILDNNFKYFAQ